MNTADSWHMIVNYVDALLDDTTTTVATATIDAHGAIAVANATPLPTHVPPPFTAITATIATTVTAFPDAADSAPSPSPSPSSMPAPAFPFAVQPPVASASQVRNLANAPAVIVSAPRWLRMTVAANSYALELLRVQEVIRVAPIIAMRGTVRALLGVTNLRGRVVPVFDLGLWLGGSAVLPDEHSRIVVVDRGDELVGVLVSSIEDIVALGGDRIELLAGGEAGAVVGIARVGPVPTVLLDAEALFG